MKAALNLTGYADIVGVLAPALLSRGKLRQPRRGPDGAFRPHFDCLRDPFLHPAQVTRKWLLIFGAVVAEVSHPARTTNNGFAKFQPDWL